MKDKNLPHLPDIIPDDVLAQMAKHLGKDRSQKALLRAYNAAIKCLNRQKPRGKPSFVIPHYASAVVRNLTNKIWKAGKAEGVSGEEAYIQAVKWCQSKNLPLTQPTASTRILRIDPPPVIRAKWTAPIVQGRFLDQFGKIVSEDELREQQRSRILPHVDLPEPPKVVPAEIVTPVDVQVEVVKPKRAPRKTAPIKVTVRQPVDVKVKPTHEERLQKQREKRKAKREQDKLNKTPVQVDKV